MLADTTLGIARSSPPRKSVDAATSIHDVHRHILTHMGDCLIQMPRKKPRFTRAIRQYAMIRVRGTSDWQRPPAIVRHDVPNPDARRLADGPSESHLTQLLPVGNMWVLPISNMLLDVISREWMLERRPRAGIPWAGNLCPHAMSWRDQVMPRAPRNAHI